MGFESRAVAQETLRPLGVRLVSFGLMLHGSKTRLIEFGRFAVVLRQRRAGQRPFAFLGVPIIAGGPDMARSSRSARRKGNA